MDVNRVQVEPRSLGCRHGHSMDAPLAARCFFEVCDCTGGNSQVDHDDNAAAKLAHRNLTAS
eukprot:1089905-Rhodomonas_salina.1